VPTLGVIADWRLPIADCSLVIGSLALDGSLQSAIGNRPFGNGSLLAAAEFQQRDFRRASVPDRKHHCAETAVDVNLGISLAPKPFQHAAARTARGTPLTSNCDLATMCMTAQHEINRRSNGSPEYDWIVRQQKFHLVAARARESQRQVFQTDHVIVHAGEPDTLAIQLEMDAFVNQDRDPLSAE
jgi:hypothetical protein